MIQRADQPTVLVAGGAGFIGSQTCKLLAKAGFLPVVLDDLSGGYSEFVKWGPLVTAKISNGVAIRRIFDRYHPVAVIHFASKINVGESVRNPDLYYENNVLETLRFLQVLREYPSAKVVFSSSAAVYGEPQTEWLEETHPQTPVNPYGRTKKWIEDVLQDFSQAYEFKSISLRYFNAAGGDSDQEIGESHRPETHLIPLILQGMLESGAAVTLYGKDYPTIDGTCIRDYIHVQDLAHAHLAAVRYMINGGATTAVNLGSGQGYSVLEVVNAVANTLKREVPIQWGNRRLGDPARLVASIDKAKSVLNWAPQQSDLVSIIKDAWAWQKSRKL